MVKKKKKSSLRILQYRRYKWARIGSNIIHFTLGLLFTLFGYLAVAISNIMKFFADIIILLYKKIGKKNRVKISDADVEKNSSKFKAETERPEVTFDDIYGLDEVKKEIRLRVIEPLKHPEIAKAYNLTVGGAILLEGPPGNGKTDIARAIANEVDAAFFLFEVGKILGASGASERNCELFFKEVRKCSKSIVFVDEAEGAFPSRVKNPSTVRTGLTTQFLREVDGFRKSAEPDGFLILISATNYPELIDKAAVSRHGIRIHVPKIDKKGRLFVIERELRNCSHELSESDFCKILDMTEGYSGRDVVQTVSSAQMRSFERAIASEDEMVLPVKLCDFEEAVTVVG